MSHATAIVTTGRLIRILSISAKQVPDGICLDEHTYAQYTVYVEFLNVKTMYIGWVACWCQHASKSEILSTIIYGQEAYLPW